MIEWLNATPQSVKRPTFFLTHPVYWGFNFRISACRFLITRFLYAGFYCISCKALLFFEMLLGHFKVCQLSEKNSHQNMEVHSFLGLFLHFPVDNLEDVKRTEFQIYFGARNLNEEQMPMILQTKYFLGRLQIHYYAEFS